MDAARIIKLIGKAMLLMLSALIFIVWSFYLCFGNAEYLVIAAIIIIIVLARYMVKKGRNLTVSLIWILVVTNLALIYLGIIGGCRGLTFSEKAYILNYLNEKYEENDFDIVTARVTNRELTGWENLLRFQLFDWSEIETEVTDKNGHTFHVNGLKGPFFQDITLIYDDYDVLNAVWENTGLFQDRVVDAYTVLYDANVERFNEDKNVKLSDYYVVDLYMTIDYSEAPVQEFDTQLEKSHMRSIKEYVRDHGYSEHVNIRAMYDMKDGGIRITYNFDKDTLRYGSP